MSSEQTLKPLISVIVPTYNRASLLLSAIRSVLDQQYDDLQLIVIDDGSTDNTFTVVSAIGDPRIELVRFEQNRGIGSARHEGVSRARGEFIAFIDSDDIWLSGKLELQLSLFQKYPHLDLIFGNFLNINHVIGTSEPGFDQIRMRMDGLVTRPLENGIWETMSGFQRAMLERNFMLPSTIMFRKKLINATGNFTSSLSGPEDFEFWWRLAAHGARFAYTEQPLVERHKDSQSITSQTIRFAPHYLRALELCEQTSRQCGQDDLLPALRRAKHRTWCGLIRAYALQGNRQAAVRCFTQSLRYGVSRQAFVYTAAALAGPVAIKKAKLLRHMITKGQYSL